MATNTTTTLTSKIGFQIITDNANESSFINTTSTLLAGTGANQANYGVYNQVELDVGEKAYLNFQSLTKPILDAETTISFSTVKALGIFNEESNYGRDVSVQATGNGLTDIFNGGTGNVLIKPKGVYQYFDIISGIDISASNRDLQIANMSATGITVSYSVIGITG
jgi:hypothetical protein